MSATYSYEQIASDFGLWVQYMDTGAEMSRQEFDGLSVEQKIQLQVEAFGIKLNGLKAAQSIAQQIRTASIAAEVAEKHAIAKDQSWTLGMTKYTFDDNSVLAVRDVEVFGLDADDEASIGAYAAWLGDEIDQVESDDIDRMLNGIRG